MTEIPIRWFLGLMIAALAACVLLGFREIRRKKRWERDLRKGSRIDPRKDLL